MSQQNSSSEAKGSLTLSVCCWASADGGVNGSAVAAPRRDSAQGVAGASSSSHAIPQGWHSSQLPSKCQL